MITLTDAALRELDAYFEGKDRAAVRIYLAPGGCGGPRLSLALDEPNEADTVFEEKGHTLCINSELSAQAGDISIDFTEMGFFVDSELSLASGGGCSGCSGCGAAS